MTDAELREALVHLNGLCLPTDHKCTYESTRNDSQILDETMKLIKARDAKRDAYLQDSMRRITVKEISSHLIFKAPLSEEQEMHIQQYLNEDDKLREDDQAKEEG